MRDFKRYFYEIETLGFTIVDNLISQNEAQELKRHLGIALEADNKKYLNRPQKKEHHIMELVTAGQIFIDFLDNDIMHKIYSHFLSDTCILYTYSSTILRPGDVLDSHSIHVDTPRLIPGYHHALSMTLALDDFIAENGATLCLPGSHKFETPPPEETFKKYAVATIRKAGDALFWNPRLFHSAGENKSSKARNAISTYAVRAFMKQRLDFPRMVPKEYLVNATERVKRFLGFNVRVPVGLDEFYVEPEKRLYKANQD